jgi:hypothetical protein
VSAYFAEFDLTILFCHIDDHVGKACIERNILIWNSGSDVAFEGLAVPMTTEGIVVRSHEPLNLIAFDRDSCVHGTVPVAVMFDEIE